jgi:hypothetical protein
MGKRSNFERRERDFYPTPHSAVLPLLPHLKPQTRFFEPCAGDGALVDHLSDAGHLCMGAFDIEPRRKGIKRADVLSGPWHGMECFITNPPWEREILHKIILHLPSFAPTWLLFEADWPHTKQSIPYLPLLRKIVAVGRVKWIPDSKFVGKDNCCWYLFEANKHRPVQFIGRGA